VTLTFLFYNDTIKSNECQILIFTQSIDESLPFCSTLSTFELQKNSNGNLGKNNSIKRKKKEER